MSTKRRVAVAAASPELKLRSQKRRKLSNLSHGICDGHRALIAYIAFSIYAGGATQDNDFVDFEESNRASSEPVDDAEADFSSGSQNDEDEPDVDFEGDSLQTAQDKILSELFRLRDSDGEEVAYPFIGKPDRNLYRDYYEVIHHPVSLRSIQKKVRGTDGRKKGTKMTAFPTWLSFEEEVSYLWRNAREYNEDGSEICVLAGVLESYFQHRVAEAKKLVPDPIQVDGHPELPRIKLKMASNNPEVGAQRLTLKMARQTPGTPRDDKAPSGVTVDSDSLKRRQEVVRSGSISQEVDTHHMSPRTRSLRRNIGSPKSSAATTPPASEQSHGLVSGRDTTSVVKDETPGAPFQRTEMRSSAGLHGVPLDSTNGLSHQDAALMHPAPELSPLDSLWRRPGQDANSALIRNVQILTHPTLSLKEDFCLDIPPSSTLSQQTITIPLPPLTPLVDTQRQVKVVALMGTQRLHATGDASTLAYDIQLHPGTTKVDLEAIAGPARGAPKSGPPGSEVDYERVTIFFNLLR
ncbi:uncharacterized protein N7484_001725 [Penicillium longicatenatum]|uniref:uncharacterized protein n=1 Tax=Penicillium longicatenatum TaxID=1561947 RepID=UPI0025497584|nr:uncharacterized protein N7484_001725 [Penicillium longicatenatum]KAJ5658076.1 hypothetical protein N7484_001725 [Penicillium longicatenatum]